MFTWIIIYNNKENIPTVSVLSRKSLLYNVAAENQKHTQGPH